MSPTKRRLIIALATLMLASLIPVAVMAAGGAFTDDDTSTFEADIEWLADAGVTLGCNPPDNTLFCPKNNVTREQMAAFMRRFAVFLGAEDGVVSNADHASTAGNAQTVGGAYALDFQPATFAFKGNNDLRVNTAGTHSIAAAKVTTTDSTGWICRGGQTAKAFINVRASGYTNLVGAGEGGWLQLTVNGTVIDGSRRYFKNIDSPYALEWVHTSTGGTDSFAFQVYEGGSSDDYYLLNNNLTVEVLQNTRCTSLVMTTSETPDLAGPSED